MSVPPVALLEHMAPVLVVDRVEPCVGFWIERFGFVCAGSSGPSQARRSSSPRHQTAYGSTEIYVREPVGHVVGFAQF